MKKTNYTRHNKLAAAAAAAVTIAGAANAATVIGLTADAPNSSVAAYGSTLANLTNDAFAYDPLDPTSTSPNVTGNATAALGFHAADTNGTDTTLSFTLSHTTTLADPTVVVDLWGRSNYTQASDVGQRDEDIDVILYTANYGTVAGTVSGLSIDQGDGSANPYVRATFDTLAVGTTITGLQIVAHDTVNPAANYFTLYEVEAAAIAAVPEPSSTALLGLGGLALILRRRK